MWTLTITCPRPRNRAVDDFHTRPDKVTRVGIEWFGEGAQLSLTSRTVRLHCNLAKSPQDVTAWHDRLATALHCLYLDTHSNADGRYRLPRPVRTEIRESDSAA